MDKLEKRIERILEDLKENNEVNIVEFLNDFNVTESTLRRDYNKTIKYIAHENLFKGYSIDLELNLKQYISNTKYVAFLIANDENTTHQSYLENLFSKINKLPKRSDLKYKEIENFKDYELTYSIVNEMAIRNLRVKKLIKVFHKLASFQDARNSKSSFLKTKLEYNIELSKQEKEEIEIFLDSCNIYSKKNTLDKIFNILKNDYMVSPLECNIDEIDYIPGTTIYATLQNFDTTDIKPILNGEARINTTQYNIPDFRQSVAGDRHKMNNHDDGFILYQKKYNDSEDFEYSIIEPNFSKNIIDNNITTLAINFSLPKEEIVAYISHIKDSLSPQNKDRRIKTPDELTRNQIYLSSFTKLQKSEIVNYFFIYDFVKKRIDYLKKEYTKDKKENIFYNEDVEMELTQDVFKDKFLQKQTNLDEYTIKRYFYTMCQFIDKLEYRELVNSAFCKANIEDGRFLSTKEQQINRNKVIRGFEQNLPIRKIAQSTVMSESRIYALKKQYESGDINLIIDKRGRTTGHKKISNELDNQIITNLIDDGYQDNKIWDKKLVKTMIKEKLNIDLSMSTVVNYLKEKQIKFDNNIPYKNKNITIKEWIESSFPNIKDEAKNDDAVIVWTDAYSCQEIKNNIYLKRLVTYPHNKFMFTLYSKGNRIDSFIDYLNRLINLFNKKIFLIADSFEITNESAYDMQKIYDFQQKNRKKLKLY